MGDAIIDRQDLELVAEFHWYFDGKYAASGRTRPITRMHRLIAGAKLRSEVVDHVNRNKLDNRRRNLRIVTLAQSAQNCGSHGGTSEFRGVRWDSHRQKWMAQAKLNGKYVFLGRFDDEIEAAKAAERFRQKHMPFYSGARSG